MATTPISRPLSSLAATTIPRRLRKPWICSHCHRPRHRPRRYATTTTTTPPEELSRARTYCLTLLRQSDLPSSLLLPYIPAPARHAYLALRAFNIEIARTADTTSTPTIGSMRLQFQREAVASALHGKPPKQPIAILLAEAARDLAVERKGRRWSQSWFMRMIDTREKYLTNPPYADLKALENYAENTYSTLLYLTLQALPMSSLTADHIASHIGKATGITTLLRGLPLLAFPAPSNQHSSNPGAFAADVGARRRGTVGLPLDIMAEAGVREEDVLRNGSAAHGLRDAVFAVATRANDHLITARQLLSSIQEGGEESHPFEHAGEEEHRQQQPVLPGPGGTRRESPREEVERAFPVFMAGIPTALWLERLEKVDFDVFSPSLRVTDWRLPWRIWRGWRGRKV